VSHAALPHRSFPSRSFLAFVLVPEPPIFDWLAALDQWTSKSPGFFAGKAVVLDLAAVTLSERAIAHVIDELAARGIRIMGLEGLDPVSCGPGLPPVLVREHAEVESERAAGASGEEPRCPPSAASCPASLVIERPIRSGESVIFPPGDLTVLGSVASGAEVMAGGSIHVYGTLRGRALAGTKGDARARIFCERNEAELFAIDGYYLSAEHIEAHLRGRAVQAWLEHERLRIAALE
jgi:septum site-determining protein MinC